MRERDRLHLGRRTRVRRLQDDPGRRACAGDALDLETSAVRIDDAFDDRKAEADAVTPTRRLPEPVEDMRQVLGRDARAGVRDPQGAPLAAALASDPDRAARG